MKTLHEKEKSELDISEQLLCFPGVIKLVKKSRSSIYRDMKRGDFPQPISIGLRSMAWKQSDLDMWLNTRQQKTYFNETHS